MNFLKTMGQFLLIVGLWCGSVLGVLYLIERDRMQESACWEALSNVRKHQRLQHVEQ